MTRARQLADMISDGVIGTTELADDAITPVKLDETGNYTIAQLGIGTISPDLKLDVSHNVSSEYVATFQNTADNLELKIGTTSGLLNIQGANASNNAAYNIALNAEGGNVGIGISSPDSSAKLHTQTANSTARTITESTNASGYVGYRATNGTGYWEMQVDGANQGLRWLDDGSEVMRITSDGSVGIGGIVPKTTNATVTGSLNVNRTGIIVRNNEQVYWSSNIYWDASDQMKSLGSGYGVATAFIPSDGSQRFYTTTASAGSADANLTLDETMRLDSSGNVGIGVINPSDYYAETLVVGAVGEGGITIKANATTDTNYLMFADGTSGNAAYRGYIGYSHNSPEYLSLVSYGHQRFYTSSNGSTTIRAMDIDTSGNVGIGALTGAIDAKLHVVGNTKLGSASSASWTNSLNDAGGLDLFVGSGSKALTVWDDNRQSAPRFQVDRDGQVGIGRAPISTFKLDVHDEVSGNWLAHFENTHNSNGYGVKIRAGDDGNVTSFRVSNYDNTNTLLNVYGDGSVTKPNTPAFHAKRNSNLSNPTVATVYDLSFVSERFDQGNDFNGTVFTAPVTGKYYLAVNLRLEQLQTNASYYQVYITTSNEAYQITLDPNFSGNLNYYGVAFSVLADMDGGDTAKIQWYQVGGSTGADINISSYFCGHLVA